MAGYIDEEEFEAMFDVTIDATTLPTTTNFVGVSGYFSHWLNVKLGIASNLATDPMLSTCKLYISFCIKLYGKYNETADRYVSPEQYINTQDFVTRIQQYDFMVSELRSNLTSEDEPAYYRDMYGYFSYGGGAPI